MPSANIQLNSKFFAPAGERPGDVRAAYRACFYWSHAVVPALVLALLTTLLIGLGLDLVVADWIYRMEGGSWWFKDTWLAHDLIHRGGRDLSVIAWIGIVIAWASSFLNSSLRAWRRPLAYLVLATLLSVTTISVIKIGTHMDCPWDLARYGGIRDYFGLFADRPDGLPSSDCFPAAHASSGYCWVALYFFFATAKPGWRYRGLAAGLSAGLLFGISQQLRGAHFLSHDVWALAICWFIALGLYAWLFATETGSISSGPPGFESDAAQVP